MKKTSIACCVFLLFTIFACKNDQKPSTQTTNNETSPQKSATPATVTKKNIVFFGNSLTAAYGLSPEEGFVALIQQKLDSLALPFRCVNAGLSGETTADGLNRVDWVLRQPLDIFVLELGGNDALRGLPVENSKKNLQGILEKVKSKYPACKILITGMLAPPNLGARYTADFKNMYTDLAKTNQVTLMPFLLEGVGGDPKFNQTDGIHPNVEGNKILAKNVWAALEKLVF